MHRAQARSYTEAAPVHQRPRPQTFGGVFAETTDLWQCWTMQLTVGATGATSPGDRSIGLSGTESGGGHNCKIDS
jgi:hypothetical protein